MSPEQEVEFRRTNVVWFDNDVADGSGRPVRMYSVVTPVAAFTQTYAIDEPPITVGCGTRCVVVGVAGGDRDWLWLEIDETGEWNGSHVVVHRTGVRQLADS
jgi:hypothetical protein